MWVVNIYVRRVRVRYVRAPKYSNYNNFKWANKSESNKSKSLKVKRMTERIEVVGSKSGEEITTLAVWK